MKRQWPCTGKRLFDSVRDNPGGRNEFDWYCREEGLTMPVVITKAKLVVKICTKCLAEKPVTSFYNRASTKDGLCPHCKECDAIRKAKWKKDNPTKYKQYFRAYLPAWRKTVSGKESMRKQYRVQNLKKYGLRPEEYDAMFVAQGKVCAICGVGTNGRAFPVDHDNETGKVRGILCDACNVGIGHLRHSEVIMKKAIKYLKETK